MAHAMKPKYLFAKDGEVSIKMQEIEELRQKINKNCTDLLNITDDYFCKKQLRWIIENSNKLMTAKSQEDKARILGFCRELKTNKSCLPNVIPTPSNLASRSHTVAQVCLFVLASSAALAVGATFGAWYFDFLTASYFIDSLACALSVIGIPSVCLGLFSYGLYSAHKNPAKENLDELLVNVDALIEKIEPLGEQHEEQQEEQKALEP